MGMWSFVFFDFFDKDASWLRLTTVQPWASLEDLTEEMMDVSFNVLLR
jgi:hypothetical protein